MKAFDSYELLITPVSPVHIGTGESYEPTNYIIEDDTLHEFDTGVVLRGLLAADRERLLGMVSRRPDENMILSVQKFFHERRESLMASAVHRIPVLEGVAELYRNRVGQPAQRQDSGRQVINKLEIDRTAFNPVTRVPVLFGSSLKGAIRTALLDSVNEGKPLKEIVDRRTSRLRKEDNAEFQQRVFKFRAGKFELDPMRLVQIGDAVWRGEHGLPPAEVHLAVNRKKAPVRDEGGNLRRSQAEQRGLYQILECVPGLRYRAFSARFNVQHVDGVAKTEELPDTGLRFDIRRIAHTCNAFYQPILSSENRLLAERGYVNESWRGTMESLLREAAPRLERGEVFLLRVGRHSGAESVTVHGVRSIKIMKGRDQPSENAASAKTVWLAAQAGDQQASMLPFGWLLVEIFPMEGHGLDEWEALKEACEAHLASGRAWAARQAENARQLEQLRAKQAAQRAKEEEEARERAEASARADRAKAEREEALASMTSEMRAIEEFRFFYLEQKAKGAYRAGQGPFDERGLAFFKSALAWQDALARRAAARVLRETIKEWTDWPSNKERRADFRAWLGQLEGG